MKVLGISAYYHDSAACVVEDGRVLVAVEEERFSRIKHDNSFPVRAVEYCLREVGIGISEVDMVAYYEKPVRKFERLLEMFVDTYPFSWKMFTKAMPEWLGGKVDVEKVIRKKLSYRGPVKYVPHHLSHAAASYYSAPFEKAAVLVVDGVGEYETVSMWHGEKGKLEYLKSVEFPHSLGLLYSTITAFLGYRVNNDEYKMMGLAAYGKPSYLAQMRELVEVKEDGSFRLKMKYFSFRESYQMWSVLLEDMLGPSKDPSESFTERHKDIAASVQQLAEELYLDLLRELARVTGEKNVCVAGGVALNSVANGKIHKESGFRRVHILGAAGDSGASMGAAFMVSKKFGKKFVRPEKQSLYLGPSYSEEEIEGVLAEHEMLDAKRYEEGELVSEVAKLLAHGKVVGWFRGRMEFGPRALGGRSILVRADPKEMKIRINELKLREQYRPFAASVLQERVGDCFQVPDSAFYAPYMNYCFRVKPEWEERLAALVHEDKSCRIQTVSERENGVYYRLLKKYEQITKIPVILNTSFNVKGEPIVENPRQAIEDFLRVPMDYLVLENNLVKKD